MQVGGDSYCLLDCASSACTGTDRCGTATDYAGNPQSVCIPESGGCTGDVTCPTPCDVGSYCDVNLRTCVQESTASSGPTTSSSGAPLVCGALVGPAFSPTGCTCPSTHQSDCQPNGCYAGWWCDTGTNRCHAAPTGECGGSSSSTSTSSTATSGQTCGTLVGPQEPTTACHCAAYNPADCQPNSCFGGWWCDVAAGRCKAPPTSCPGSSSSASGAASSSSSAGTVAGSVGPQGGTLDTLRFAVVGDTRPASIDDTAAYPTGIITPIYQGIAAFPRPLPFVVTTGDYVFARPSGTQASSQLDLYLRARAEFPRTVFFTLGNHECTGASASNCADAWSSNNNYRQFMSRMMGALGQDKPYYRFNVNHTGGAWTAKFIVVALNAWDAAQQAWLQTQLQERTTYTFVIRHEPPGTASIPGIAELDALVATYPPTLQLCGHTHIWNRKSGRVLVVGNGGAPVVGTINYGFTVVEQQPDNSLTVTDYDYDTRQQAASFTLVP